jgi:hypothetical protein
MLEEAIVALTRVTERHNYLLEQLLAKAPAPKAVEAAPAPAPVAKEDVEVEVEQPKRGRPKKEAAAKKVTEDELAGAFAAYLHIDDEDEREARKVRVKKILVKYSAPKARAIAAEDRVAAMADIQALLSPTVSDEEEELV